MEGDTICLQDLFAFRQTGIDEHGHAKRPLRGVRRAPAAARPPARPRCDSARSPVPAPPARVASAAGPCRRRGTAATETEGAMAAISHQTTSSTLVIAASVFGLVLSLWLIWLVVWVFRRLSRRAHVQERLGTDFDAGRPAGRARAAPVARRQGSHDAGPRLARAPSRCSAGCAACATTRASSRRSARCCWACSASWRRCSCCA